MKQLPDHYYKAEDVNGAYSDKDWILEQLGQLTGRHRESAIDAYSIVYLNEGRSAANTRLRQYVARVNSVKNGLTQRPGVN